MFGYSTPTEGAPSTLPRSLALLVVVTGLGIAADQAGKGWAFASWRGPGGLLEVVPGLFAGAQGRNFGAFLSLDGREAPATVRVVLTLVGLTSIAIVLRWAVIDRVRWRAIDAVAGGLVIGGALSNLVDRLALGFVRDYLILGAMPRGIFNTADVFMIVGVLLFAASWASTGLRSIDRVQAA